jgi:MFS family permease
MVSSRGLDQSGMDQALSFHCLVDPEPRAAHATTAPEIGSRSVSVDCGLARLTHRLLYGLLFAMGLAGASFVLVWPIGREVNPPHLDGVAVAVVNFGGFLGAALTQGPLGALLDAQWAGALVDGVRRYPVQAYRTGFAVCAALVAGAALLSLLMHETRGLNIHAELRGSPPGPRIGTEPV